LQLIQVGWYIAQSCPVPRLEHFPSFPHICWLKPNCQQRQLHYVRFEAFTAVTMKDVVFWDVALCRSRVNRRFEGTYHLHLQGRKIRERVTSVSRLLQLEPPVENTQLYKNMDLHNTTSQKTTFFTIMLVPKKHTCHWKHYYVYVHMGDCNKEMCVK
jgi:hypothetical protein